MKTKLLNLLVLLVFTTSVVIAQEMPRFERGNRMANMQKIRQNKGEKPNQFLMLTQEQKEAMKPIVMNGVKELKPLKDELRELSAKHQTLTTASKPDLNAINKSIEKLGQVKIQMAKVQAKRQQEFRALLTEEQLMKLDSKKEMMKKSPMMLKHQGKMRM